jgi:hypothetical protein
MYGVPVIYTDPEVLAQAIIERFEGPAIIGIDGWTGAGKTTLGTALANLVGGSAYDLDVALTHDLNGYADAVRLDEVAEALKQPDGLLFVSGICLQQVLSDAARTASAQIYLKRMATWGWADEDELSGKLPEVVGASGEAVRQELRSYHAKWQPHLLADYEFQRLG